MEAFCAEHGVSRSWFYKIRARSLAGGMMGAIEPTSTRPESSPNRTPEAMIELVVAMRGQMKSEGMDYGPLSVLSRLRRNGFTDLPSRATVARVFTAAGVVKAEPRKKPRSSYRRFVYPAPNCLWQIDAFEWTLSTGMLCVVFQIIDDHSRLALATLAWPAENAAGALRVVEQAISRHGVPQKFLSDNGIAFNPTRRGYSGQLVVFLQSLGVEPITGKPYKPTTQGKNERFHRTIHLYLNAHPVAATIAELQVQIDTFDVIYNTQREHQSLSGHQTPQEAWDRTPAIASPTPPVVVLEVEPVVEPPAMTITSPTVLAMLADASARQATPPGEAIRVVTPNGKTGVLSMNFKIGTYYAGQTVHIRWTYKIIDFYDTQGTLIATYPMPPKGTTYIGNGLTRRNALYSKTATTIPKPGPESDVSITL